MAHSPPRVVGAGSRVPECACTSWHVLALALCPLPLCPCSKRKDSEPRTKCLLNNADLAPHHPKDPVEMRRINFQTPGMS